jgi:hypothetical protein
MSDEHLPAYLRDEEDSAADAPSGPAPAGMREPSRSSTPLPEYLREDEENDSRRESSPAGVHGRVPEDAALPAPPAPPAPPAAPSPSENQRPQPASRKLKVRAGRVGPRSGG